MENLHILGELDAVRFTRSYNSRVLHLHRLHDMEQE